MKKKLLITFIFTLFFGLFCGLAGYFGIFEKLDLRVYDGLLHLKKDPPASEKIVLAQIDEIDIDKLGDWPWSRNILADTLIRMKELGTANAVFDIEYISPSLKSVASNAEEHIKERIYETQDLTEKLIYAIPNSALRGYPVSELKNLADSIVNENLYPEYSSLYNFIDNNVSFDNDEYFSKAAQFFENTFLTVNNQDLGYSSITEDDVAYIKERFLTYQVEDDDRNILKDNDYTFLETYDGIGKGFTPALHKMMMRAAGAGFTNSNVDSDGTRRRMELLYDYDDAYLAQLVFAPILKIVDSNILVRTKNRLIVKDALLPGASERKDIVIPLDNHGRMLINWQHENEPEEGSFYGFKAEHIYSINQLDLIEANIYNVLKILQAEYNLFDEDGYLLEYGIKAADLIAEYKDILEYKEYLLSRCTGYDVNGVPYDGNSAEDYKMYFDLRDTYFSHLKDFANATYFTQIEPVIRETYSFDPEILDIQLQEYGTIFEVLESDILGYLDLFADMKNKLNGAYCIIGMTAASTTDIGAIPFKKQYANIGIHANVMNTILTENFIFEYPWYFALIVSVIFSLLCLFLCGLSNTKQNILNLAVKLLVTGAFIVLFVNFDIYIPMVSGVIVFGIFDYLAGLLFRYLSSSKEKRFITQIAASFANKDTVEQLRKNPELFSTKGEKKLITALFSDVQKFSTLSESLGKIYGDEAPNKLVEILNEYLGDMSNEILYNNGNIDKYEGDAIISMFGAPDPLEMHTKEEWAYLCLDSAIRMKKQEVKFNDTHKELFEPHEITLEDGTVESVSLKPLQTRIGVNSGDAYVGLMGSKTENFSKLNYTMMGDTVNLASRLEGVNKAYGSWIMCSNDTWDLANTGDNEGKITVRRLDKVRVVGRSTPVQLYNVLGFTEEITEEEQLMLDAFNEALDKYLEKDFRAAEMLFKKASDYVNGDPTSIIFAERCNNFIKKGVLENWDGVMNMTSK